MLSWFAKYSKSLNFFGGIAVLLVTLVLYFYSSSEGVASEAQKGQKKPFERSYSSSNTIVRKSQEKKDMSVFSKKLKSSKQGTNFLLFLMLAGFSMLIYSLYSQYKQQKKS